MTSPKNLHQLCVDWDRTPHDLRARPRFVALLRHIEAHSALRYTDYGPFKNDGKPFLSRLHTWVTQTADVRLQQAMLEFVHWILYLDEREMRSLYCDAFRRIIVPWLTTEMTIEEELSSDYRHALRLKMQTVSFFSITESFQHKLFSNLNTLTGMPKPVIFGESIDQVPGLLQSAANASAIVVLEDIVGTGKQAAKVLKAVIAALGTSKPILFVPLLILESAMVQDAPLMKLNGISVLPATIIPSRLCLTKDPHAHEPEIFRRIRSVVELTRTRVLEKLDELDDVPKNEFGYEGVGATVVTHQNTPNNSLPLIHHRAPNWEPLFRRLHHAKGAGK